MNDSDDLWGSGESINDIVARLKAQEAAQQAKRRESGQNRLAEQARQRRAAADNQAAVNQLADQFFQWVRTNGIRPRHYRRGYLRFWRGWIIGSDSEDYGDPQSYHYGTRIYNLLMSPGGRLVSLLHEATLISEIGGSGRFEVYKKANRSVGNFGAASVRASIARIVKEEGKAWPWR